jgi:threonylcarbamoyladenosine tRNA methylthiotransferase MtaB
MRRRYLRELYAERVDKIKTLMPHCAIGVDVIVGFPGESEEEFMETYNFINGLDISYLHVFTYSERENTPAAVMDDVVALPLRKERSSMLHILSDKKRRSFYREHENTQGNVLLESQNTDGSIHGFTENYVKVVMDYEEGLENSILAVDLCKTNADGVMTAKFNAVSPVTRPTHQ